MRTFGMQMKREFATTFLLVYAFFVLSNTKLFIMLLAKCMIRYMSTHADLARNSKWRVNEFLCYYFKKGSGF